MKAQSGSTGIALSTRSLNSPVDGDRWSMPLPGRFTPGITRYPFYRSLGGLQGRSGRVREKTTTGFRSTDFPARFGGEI